MKNMKHFVLACAVIATGLLTVPVFVFQPAAASPIIADSVGQPCTLPDGTPGATTDNLGTCCPPDTSDGTSCFYKKYVNPAIKLLSALVGVAVVIAIIWGGIEYITSEGDPQKAANGKKRIVGALVGLVAFILLYTVLQFLAPGGILNGQ